MKLLDANLLIYAVDDRSRLHARARNWLEDQLSGAETVAFAWLALIAFLRVTTNPALPSPPLDPTGALDIMDEWLARSNTTVVHPTERHARVLRQLLEPLGTAGNLTNDAHLAALAIEHGADLCSADVDFARFPGLRWVNPLA